MPPTDQVLADTAWLQAFTHSLVRGWDLAGDVAQETWLAGMTGRNVGDGPSRPWLAQVARNLAIKLLSRESRRRQVELDMPGRDPSPSTAEIVEEAELQRAAVEALMALNEPYRMTLLLRFMKGLCYREVALRTNVPVETVRTRIKRGLALLRARLDRTHGGRSTWVPGIVIPTLPAFSTLSLWGIALMKIKTKAAVAAVVLLAGMFCIWYLSTGVLSAPADTPGSTDPMVGALRVQPEQSAPETAPVRTPVALQEIIEPRTARLLVHATWRDTDEPAASVGIRLEGERGSLGHYASTDEVGTARFEGLRPASFHMTMDRLPGDGKSWELELEAGETEVFELVVPGGLDAYGTVVDEYGVPVADAQIVSAWGGTAPQWSFPVARSRIDGSFHLRGLGEFNLIGARKPGYAPSDFQATFRARRMDGGAATLRLVLPGGPAALEGYVYDPQGRPVPQAWVAIGDLQTLGGGPPQALLRTDSRGLFKADSLQPGTHPVHVYGEGFAPWKGTAECRALESSNVSVQLQRGATIYGHVTDGEGTPVVDVRVEGPYWGYPHRSSGVTDENGRYRIEDLPEGEATLKAYHAQLGRVERTFQLALGKEQVWDIALEPGLQIRGVLLNQKGEPLKGWWLRNDEGARAVADDEGRFSFNNCEDRLYTLRVSQEPWLVPVITRFEDVRPTGAQQTFTVLDDTMPSALVTGRILTPEGGPAGGVELSLYQGGQPILAPTGTTQADGSFQVGPLPPGTYSMSGYTSGYTIAGFEEFILGINQTLQLPDAQLGYGAYLNLSLDPADPDQLEGLDVRATHKQLDQVYYGTVRGDQASLPLLRPGSYDLTVSGPNIETQTIAIQLRAHDSKTLPVDLR